LLGLAVQGGKLVFKEEDSTAGSGSLTSSSAVPEAGAKAAAEAAS